MLLSRAKPYVYPCSGRYKRKSRREGLVNLGARQVEPVKVDVHECYSLAPNHMSIVAELLPRTLCRRSQFYINPKPKRKWEIHSKSMFWAHASMNALSKARLLGPPDLSQAQ